MMIAVIMAMPTSTQLAIRVPTTMHGRWKQYRSGGAEVSCWKKGLINYSWERKIIVTALSYAWWLITLSFQQQWHYNWINKEQLSKYIFFFSIENWVCYSTPNHIAGSDAYAMHDYWASILMMSLILKYKAQVS